MMNETMQQTMAFFIKSFYIEKYGRSIVFCNHNLYYVSVLVF